MAHQITKRDTMFSVKETPWHKLGVVVESAPTIAEAIRLANLDWEVYKDALFTADGKAVNAFSVRRKDTGEVVGDAVGSTWQPLQNAEAFQWFQPFVESGLASLETAGSLFAGRRVWVLAKLNCKGSEITPGDEVSKFLLLSNSHDGSLAVRCGYTPIRVVCNNTLTLAHSGTGQRKPSLLRLRHTASLQDGLEQAQTLVAEADAEFEKTAKVFRLLAKKPITGRQFRAYVKDTLALKKPTGGSGAGAKAALTRQTALIDQLLGNFAENRSVTRELLASFRERQEVESQAQEIIGARVLEELTGNLEVGRGQAATTTAKGPSWWHAYNAVTEHLTHQRGRSDETRLDQSWFGAGATLNRQALTNAIAGAAV